MFVVCDYLWVWGFVCVLMLGLSGGITSTSSLHLPPSYKIPSTTTHHSVIKTQNSTHLSSRIHSQLPLHSTHHSTLDQKIKQLQSHSL